MKEIYYDGDSASVENSWGFWEKGVPREVRDDVADRLLGSGIGFKESPSKDSRPYENRTLKELQALAKERDITISGKTKDELISDLRS